MFDSVEPKKPGTVPGNLPMGEPADMFSAVDKADMAPQPAEALPDAVPPLPGATSAVDAGLLRPKQTPSTEASPPFSQAGATDDESYHVTSPAVGRGILLTVIIAVALVIVGGGGWWIYARYVRVPTESGITFDSTVGAPAESAAETPEQTITPSEQGTLPDITTEIIDDTVLFGEPVDTDGDGLDDLQEAEIGTDANNWDTDGDGLGDREEVVSWKTNPNNPDTDGDSFADGQEVRAGYSPTGPGKYMVPPTTTP